MSMQRVFDTLTRTDPEFTKLCKTLYGDQIDPDVIWNDLVHKMNPDQSDVHVKKPNWKKKLSQVSNVVGIGAGSAALVTAARDERLQGGRYGAGKVFATGEKIAHHSLKVPGFKATKGIIERHPVKTAGALFALQAVNTAGDVLVGSSLADPGGPRRRVSKAKMPVRRVRKEKSPISDVVWKGEFSKVDTDKRLVFGWASVVSVDGVPIVDKQDDYIHHDDLEDAAYTYVRKCRIGGDMHKRDGEGAVQVADLVESMVITPEKISKLGLPASTPVGWWVGFRVNDDDAWADVKVGKRKGFSIHGIGKRTPVDYDSVMGV
jgi:Putative phage serine protease XkdF